MQKDDNAISYNTHLEILADAISDIGWWSWWTKGLPEIFQIEFGGCQLYFPPKNADMPPQTQIAIRFIHPTSISFITRSEENKDDFEWATLLHDDKIEPPSCSYGEFSFTDIDLIKSLIKQITYCKTIHGYEPTKEEFLTESFHLIFWCEDVGLAIASKNLELVNHTGDVPISSIAGINGQWWEYWRTYWTKLNTAEALPKDWACEVTIPAR